MPVLLPIAETSIDLDCPLHIIEETLSKYIYVSGLNKEAPLNKLSA